MKKLLLLTLLLALCGFSPAQSASSQPTDDPLFQTVSRLDTQLFTAYNTCDLKTFRSLLDDNIEFYHDLTGLMTGADNVTKAVQNNICNKLTRQLVPGTLEVYPINNYGAVEIGTHRFYHPGDSTNIGEAKFIHIWHNDNGTWKLTRVLSIDHHAAK